MLIVGIDPGFSGAIAMLDTETQALVIHDCPLFEIKNKKHINVGHLNTIFRDFAARGVTLAVLEWVAPMPRQGIASTGRFMEGFGIYRGLCQAHIPRIELVKPVKWKRALQLGHDKELARKVATAQFPAHSALFARVKDDGRAEAALLCIYGAMRNPVIKAVA